MSLVANRVAAGNALSIECSTYCIVPNFQGTVFLQIDLQQNFTKIMLITIFQLPSSLTGTVVLPWQSVYWYIDAYEPLLEWQTTVHCFHRFYHACI